MASAVVGLAARRSLRRPLPILCRSITYDSTLPLSSPPFEAQHSQNNNSSGIRSPLYESDAVRLPHQQSPITYFNRGLRMRAEQGNVAGIIYFWNTHVNNGIRPNELSYIQLLQQLADLRLFEQCVKVFEDMVEMGLGEKLRALNLVMLAATENLLYITRTYDLFSKHQLKPDTTTYQHHLIYLDQTNNLERAMQLITEMDSKHISVNKECMRTVILLAARLNMPKLAMELCVNAANTLGRLDDEVYMGVLIGAAATMNWKVTTWAYDALVLHNPSITFTEPLCINILNLACRQGHPALAHAMLDYLVRERIAIQEHHLAPLIGSYCNSQRNDRLREAFLMLDKFKEYGVELAPENESTSALVEVLGQDEKHLDEAYDVLLGLPKPVNIEAVNAVLQAAAITLADLPRAIGVYKELQTLQCEPTTHTYDILLAGCLKAQHKALGDKLFSDMLSRNLNPSIQTYTRLILLALTQEGYEDAFEKLEDMKERKMTPPLSVYEALVRRLVNEQDPRADLALEDMEVCGYRVSPQLRRFLLGQEKAGEGERDLLDRGAKGRSRKQNRNGKPPTGDA